VRSDRRLLGRLLQNLISNAIKYTPAGRVIVGCRRRGKQLRVDVYDTGIGIPQGKKRAVFKEFHRLDQGARVARGVGLGLSIVERIGRVLDHDVTIESKVGRGSRFSVVMAIADTAPAGQAPRAIPHIDSGRLTDITVLCVDNEPVILDGMETLLGGWGCRVLKASDFAAAQAQIETTRLRPSGLLVDYHLDGGNGIEVITALRRRFSYHFPAIVITADRSPHVRDAARAAGAHVLHKPLKPAALRAMITQWRLQQMAAAE
jgi:CheY-like chemotaxis protein/anti-sigma regulatory factor (Ser/Thr protein kinase)